MTVLPAWAGNGRVVDSSAFARSSGRACGSCAAMSAAAPVTCGAAIDVPLWLAQIPPRIVLMIETPGAARSTLRAPVLANHGTLPSPPAAVTHTTFGRSSAHGYRPVISTSSPSLPAETMNSVSSAAASASRSVTEKTSPLSDRLAIRAPEAAACLIACTSSATLPAPSRSSTRNGRMRDVQSIPAMPW